MKRVCPVFLAAVILVGCGTSPVTPVTLTFPEFPEAVAVVDLGQRVTIDVTAANDGGMGVTWTCAGAACTTLTSTPTSVTFKASGVTGMAKITATSKKQPAITKSITIVVSLNEAPDLLCGGVSLTPRPNC